MNAERVKEMPDTVYKSCNDYSVVFSGKKSNAVNGLYKPVTGEIIIHNRNFSDDNLLMYTAVHELAHHVCVSERGERGARAHTLLFWSVFHDLLDAADSQIAVLQRELGGVLLEINRICAEENIRFEDVADSEIRLSRKTRDTAVKSALLKNPDKYGRDVQDILTGIKDGEVRNYIELQAREGRSIDQIRQRVRESKTGGESSVERLTKEKNRIEKTIATLNLRLRQVIEEIRNTSGKYIPERNAADRVNGSGLTVFLPGGQFKETNIPDKPVGTISVQIYPKKKVRQC
jgi:hypothetical protein